MSSHSYIENEKNANIYININGELFCRNEAKISVFDSVFLLGDGVWEGIRLHNNKLLFIDEHLDRMFQSAKGISLNIPFSKKEIINQISKVLLKNNMDNDVHIRLIIPVVKNYSVQNQSEYGARYIGYHTEFKKTNPMIYKNGISIGVSTIRQSYYFKYTL